MNIRDLDVDALLRRCLRGMIVAAVLALSWLLLTLVWVPEVKGLRPPDAVMAAPSAANGARDAQVMANYDFVDRPLFLAGRRPVVVSEAPDESERERQARDVVSLEGFSLLGVFSSEVAQGVMLKSATGESMRLYVGQDLEGMTLVDVESRAALFSPSQGSQQEDVRLAMELGTISIQSAPPEAAVSADGAQDSTPDLDPLSFAGMDASRGRAGQSEADERRARAEEWRQKVLEGQSKMGIRPGGSSGDSSEEERVLSVGVDK